MIRTIPMDECTQARIDYAIAEKRFMLRWAARPLRHFFFKKKYLAEKVRLLDLFAETRQVCLADVRIAAQQMGECGACAMRVE